MADARAEVSRRRRGSSIWFVPVVALLLGLWMLFYSYQNQGPEIEIRFETAEGIEAGRTQVKVRDVEVGLVESVRLADDLENVIATLQLDKEAAELLRDDTQFWVVRPRLGTSGISGIATLLSGGYIQLAPGKAEATRRSFVGLEEPPVTPAGTPGLHIELTSDRGGSVSTGDPILHKGFAVGRIESESLDVESGEMHYTGFIEETYAPLVTTSTRFWNTSGFAVDLSADGVKVETGSLQTILVGGVAFGTPAGVVKGEPVEQNARFQIYGDFASVSSRPYRAGVQYVLRFDQSVRGLSPGAPVEYRGVRIGRVERVLIEEMVFAPVGSSSLIAVLIRVEPGRLNLPDDHRGIERISASIASAVENGLRASIKTGSLITGSRFVALDIVHRGEPGKMGTYAGHPTIPTLASGLEGLESQVAELLDTINDLPLEQLVDSAGRVLATTDQLLGSEAVQELPQSIDQTLVELRDILRDFSADSQMREQLARTLDELDMTLESFRRLMDTLDEQPNSLIFDRREVEDPQPKAGGR